MSPTHLRDPLGGWLATRRASRETLRRSDARRLGACRRGEFRMALASLPAGTTA